MKVDSGGRGGRGRKPRREGWRNGGREAAGRGSEGREGGMKGGSPTQRAGYQPKRRTPIRLMSAPGAGPFTTPICVCNGCRADTDWSCALPRHPGGRRISNLCLPQAHGQTQIGVVLPFFVVVCVFPGTGAGTHRIYDRPVVPSLPAPPRCIFWWVCCPAQPSAPIPP